MPKFLEKKLKAEYPGNDSAVYGTMNKLGYMHGNKETAAGKAAQAKHDADENPVTKRKKAQRASAMLAVKGK